MKPSSRPGARRATAPAGIAVEDHLEFARRLARQLRGRLPDCVDVEELESDAYYGLFKAAKKFDPARGVPFRSYAAKRIIGQMLDGLRERNQIRRDPPVPRTLSLDAEIGLVDGHPESLSDTIADDAEPVGRRMEMRDEADFVLGRIRPASRKHLVNLHLRGRSQTQLARSLGITQGAMSQRLRHIRYEIARVRCGRE
jgi:RNA polymerase sigma factor (sigma-70 family)